MSTPTKRHTHTLTRFAGGRLDGYVTCDGGDEWQVRWTSLASGRALPKPRTQDQLDRRDARCGGCGRQIDLDHVQVVQQ